MQDMVKNILLAMHDTIEGLDWMTPGHQGQGAGEAVHLQSEDRLSGQVEDLRRRARRAQLVLGRSRGRGALERRRRPRPDRQAGRPQPLGHDAADVERLLQPAAQRDRVSRPASCSRPRSTSPPPTPSTTARSAWSSATRSATASTTRARSSTHRVAWPTGGRRRTTRSSQPRASAW